eukprot:13395334-Alexandrium_andersonii.AAC.1
MRCLMCASRSRAACWNIFRICQRDKERAAASSIAESGSAPLCKKSFGADGDNATSKCASMCNITEGCENPDCTTTSLRDPAESPCELPWGALCCVAVAQRDPA